MARTNPVVFLQQVRSEVAKVSWPSRRETTITVIMVLVMTALAALFFLAVDQVLGLGIRTLLGFGG